MRKVILTFTALWILSATASQKSSAEKVGLPHVESAHPQISNQSDSPSSSPRYHDQRERIASSLTFEWQYEESRIYSKDYVLRTTDSNQPSESHDNNVAELDTEHLLIQGLRGTYWIKRAPRITYLHASEEVPLIAKGALRKSEEPLLWSQYYLGKTGSIIISSLNGSDSSVHIAFAGSNGLGLPGPFLGVMAGTMVFLGGVSPFRLLGSTLDDWRLVEVNEDEWVFELRPDDEKRKQMTGLLSFDKVRIHLSRKHGDAPAKVEIILQDSYERWTTLAYKQIRGAWIPEKVLLEYKVASQSGWRQYELISATSSSNVDVAIPVGAPVRDWRLLGRAIWQGFRKSEQAIEVSWTPELLRDLWLQLNKEEGEFR